MIRPIAELPGARATELYGFLFNEKFTDLFSLLLFLLKLIKIIHLDIAMFSLFNTKMFYGTALLVITYFMQKRSPKSL